MSRQTKIKIPTKLSLTALLSSGLTLTLSIIYVVLCVVAIIYRFLCPTDLLESASGSTFLLDTVYRIYFLRSSCQLSFSILMLTDADTVFILILITLIVAILCMITSILLILTINNKIGSDYLNVVAYIYIGVYMASVVVDVTFATHFGMDYRYMTDQLNNSPLISDVRYTMDIVRLGAFFLMTIAGKGFVVHVINIALLLMIVIYLIDYQKILNKGEHTIHKLGALDAYESHVNNGFHNDEASHTQTRDTMPMSDYSNLSYDRSDSWHHSQPDHRSRPFSYLEENRRRVPNSPASPFNEPQWQREDWPPPVPDPDYSPQPPRRLKSALKSAYM